jgi:hypothetical protein
MAILYSYPLESSIDGADLITGTKVTGAPDGTTKPTVTWTVATLRAYIWDSGITANYIPKWDAGQGKYVDSYMVESTNLITVNKKLKVVEAIQDSTGAPGTAGQVLTSTVTGTEWADAAGATFTFTQGVPAASWVIVHNLNKYPSVTVVDTANTVGLGAVVYDSANQLTVTFSGAFAGKAYLN